ncbi:hypothetical protein PVA17_21995 [Lysinibacillus sp. CNPSo 3705]|uniref:hypothetical protein n=1 Tax=Lysinibacillus sp. CNPSo 3705 TaxID=3028148 RepID=UPI0023635046|nr:hypothetical protein [Lysinibacillus sp. CNPSo 3705]MDD1505397.1 hypothetical protein [Lysinibacillus sp. CNPSo 3705]
MEKFINEVREDVAVRKVCYLLFSMGESSYNIDSIHRFSKKEGYKTRIQACLERIANIKKEMDLSNEMIINHIEHI